MISLSVAEIAEIVGGVVVGDKNIIINKLQRIEDAQCGDITFLARLEYEKYLSENTPSCVLVHSDYPNLPKENQAFIKSDAPYLAFVALIKHFQSNANKSNRGIHPSAVISSNCYIGMDVEIGPNVVIYDNCRIEDNSVIKANVVLYENVRIGKGTIVNSSVVCYQDVEIGERCIIHAGAVIGADGFGFTEDKSTGAYEKVPQVGNVIIRNDVEVGANSTIDRALLGSTIIESGVKIDNLVHVAHNCNVGENTGIAAQVGISGSTKIGKRNRIGGQVGFAGHLETCDDVLLIAQSGVSKSVNKPGAYFGSPIKERLQAFKIEACIRQLPELFSEVEKLKKNS